MADAGRLRSWRAGEARESVLSFLDDARQIPLEERLACFDNDGTLWCERPTYVQFDFFVDTLRAAVRENPALADKAEFAALLSGDSAALHELGLPRIAGALTSLCEGLTPQAFTARTRSFLETAMHPTLHRPLRRNVYQPMLELITELRALDFTVAVVTGGGTEFVRAVSRQLYGVPPEAVVGTLIEYDYADEADRPVLRRSSRLQGHANEGAVKVSNIQAQLGRRPVLAAGNSGGDRQMLEWVATGDGPTLSLLVDHDDAEREFAYVGTAETFTESEPVTAVGARLGWTVVSMEHDWETVFAPLP